MSVCLNGADSVVTVSTPGLPSLSVFGKGVGASVSGAFGQLVVSSGKNSLTLNHTSMSLNILVNSPKVDISVAPIELKMGYFVSGGAGGEANTASNVGAGQGVYSTKVGADLRFRTILGIGGITAAINGDTIEIGGGNLAEEVTMDVPQSVWTNVPAVNTYTTIGDYWVENSSGQRINLATRLVGSTLQVCSNVALTDIGVHITGV